MFLRALHRIEISVLRMKKKIIAGIGIFVLIIGVLLVALPFDYVHKTVVQAYHVPQLTVLAGGPIPQFDFGNTPVNAVTEGLSLTARDSLNIQVNVTSGIEINLSVNNGSTTVLSYSDVTSLNTNWVVPRSSDYNFVFSSSSMFTSNDVTWQVTKNFTQTDYREVTQNVQLLPFEVSYVGLVLALAGIGLTIYGTVKRETPKTPALLYKKHSRIPAAVAAG